MINDNLDSERQSSLPSNTQHANGKIRPGTQPQNSLSLCALYRNPRDYLRIETTWPGFSKKALILNSFPILPVSTLELVRASYKSLWKTWFPFVQAQPKQTWHVVHQITSDSDHQTLRSSVWTIPLEGAPLHHPPQCLPSCPPYLPNPLTIPTGHLLGKAFPLFLVSQASGVPADKSGENSGLGELPNQRGPRHPDHNPAISLNTTWNVDSIIDICACENVGQCLRARRKKKWPLKWKTEGSNYKI